MGTKSCPDSWCPVFMFLFFFIFIFILGSCDGGSIVPTHTHFKSMNLFVELFELCLSYTIYRLRNKFEILFISKPIIKKSFIQFCSENLFFRCCPDKCEKSFLPVCLCENIWTLINVQQKKL